MKFNDTVTLALTAGIPSCSILVAVIYYLAGPYAAFVTAGANFWLGMLVMQLIINRLLSKR